MSDRVHVLVTGRVQGVSFRAHTRVEAERLGLRGWVRNLPDGRVEAVAEGPRAALEAFVAWARVGPSAARVEGVEARWSVATGELLGFVIRR